MEDVVAGSDDRASPTSPDREFDEVDRTPVEPDAAAWASPDAPSADPIPATDQETGNARQRNH